MKSERSHQRINYRQALILCAVCAFALTLGATAHAQTSAFTYQGNLSDAGAPANGQYNLDFKLFDTGGNLVGATLTREDVTVANGSFTVELDFGLSPFTTLAPRQQLTSSPYSIQTADAQQLGGVPADQYVKTDDPRLTDGGPPAPGSNNYVQNTTTQQPDVSFNIGGDGLIGGAVGIGTQTPREARYTFNPSKEKTK